MTFATKTCIVSVAKLSQQVKFSSQLQRQIFVGHVAKLSQQVKLLSQLRRQLFVGHIAKVS
jgi:hypothetical protein